MVTFHIPAGPLNLVDLFPGVDFSQVEEYSLELIDLNSGSDSEETIMTTPTYQKGCCCNDDIVRIFFVNYLGGIDAVNFKTLTIEHDTTSEGWQKPLKYPLEKWDGGLQRFNVDSNETYTVENKCFDETDQAWLMELVDAPNAWIQWIGTQSQSTDYLPIRILDGKFVPRKREARYEYILEVKFEMANKNIILRN